MRRQVNFPPSPGHLLSLKRLASPREPLLFQEHLYNFLVRLLKSRGLQVARREVVEITRIGSTPIAEEGVKQIGELNQIKAELRGRDPDARRWEAGTISSI